MNSLIAVMDMGGSFLKGCLFDQHVMPMTEYVTTSINSKRDKENILTTIGGLLKRLCDGRKVTAISISTPGPFDYRRGEAKMKVKYGLYAAVPLRPVLRKSVGVNNDTPVVFLSDANAFLLGEYFTGAAMGYETFAAITLGTGLGYSVMQGGRVLTNENGRPYDVPAMDNYGDDTLDNICSGRGLSLCYARITGENKSAKQMAKEKDTVSLRLFDEMGTILGEHLRPRLKRHRVALLVVGGQVSHALPLFEKSLSASLPGVKVVAAHQPATAALYGAAAYGLGRVKPWKVYTDE